MSGFWKEVFRAGQQTDSSGETQQWTIEDLDKIAHQYNSQEMHDAPVVVGHPRDDSPAYGWIKELKREGEMLLAYMDEVDSGLSKLINEGRYKKVSIALYPDWTLRHIGFLGAIPPAVKGLKDVEYKDKDKIGKILFYEYNNEQNGDILMNDNIKKELLNWLKASYNAEMANQVQTFLMELEKKYPPTTIPPPTTPKTAEQPIPPPAGPAMSEKSDEKEDKNEKTQEFKELEAKVQALQMKNAELTFNEYFDKQVKEERLIPSQRESLKKNYMNALGSNFTETNTALNDLKEFVESYRKSELLGEIAGKNNFTESDEAVKQRDIQIDEYNKNKMR